MSFPTKEAREICYSARDRFWKCLDENNEDAKACMKYRETYEKSCAALWVKQFDKKRRYEKFKENMDALDWSLPSEEQPREKKNVNN